MLEGEFTALETAETTVESGATRSNAVVASKPAPLKVSVAVASAA
jgi:hypothetical protein